MTSIVFLVSGNGGTLKFVNEMIKRNHVQGLRIQHVISDRSCGALEYAKHESIPNTLIKYDRKNTENMLALLEDISPDIIITTFHKILDNQIVSKFRGKLINLHYSLLPSFKGLIGMQTVEEAIKLRSRFIGGTCHYVDEQVDNGAIIAQFVFPLHYPPNIPKLQNIEFRASCLLLLNSLLAIDKPLARTIGVNSLNFLTETIFFEPAIIVDTESLNEEFWSNLS